MLLQTYRLQCSININFVCTGKPKNSWDLLYYDICFIAVVWNQCHNISVVPLYYHKAGDRLVRGPGYQHKGIGPAWCKLTYCIDWLFPKRVVLQVHPIPESSYSQAPQPQHLHAGVVYVSGIIQQTFLLTSLKAWLESTFGLWTAIGCLKELKSPSKLTGSLEKRLCVFVPLPSPENCRCPYIRRAFSISQPHKALIPHATPPFL